MMTVPDIRDGDVTTCERRSDEGELQMDMDAEVFLVSPRVSG